MTISFEKREEILAALKADPNVRHVARQIDGVSIGTVWNIAKAGGVKLAGRGRPRIPEEKRTEIITALKADPNVSHVVRQIGGVSHETVRKIAAEEKITLNMRGRSPVPVKDRDKIIAALKEHSNATLVSRQVEGSSYSAVLKVAKAAAIELTEGKAAGAVARSMPREKREQIIAALEAEPNSKKVARMTGFPQSTVWKTARQEGIELTAGKAACGRYPRASRQKAAIPAFAISPL